MTISVNIRGSIHNERSVHRENGQEPHMYMYFDININRKIGLDGKEVDDYSHSCGRVELS